MSFASRDVPRVVVLCGVPILGEAVSAALDQVAEVRCFPAGGRDTVGLVRALAPDGLLVDTDEDAWAVAGLAYDLSLALVHVSLRERRLRVLRGGVWEDVEGDGLSPEAIRNAVLGGIFGREAQA